MPRRRRVRLVLALAMVLSLVLWSHGAAAAQDAPAPDVPTQDIIPDPNSGTEPSEAGDRGGALQLVLLGAVLAGIAGIALHVAIQARQGRDRRSERARMGSRQDSTVGG